MLPGIEQYYALCVEEEDGSTQIAFFELRREALPGALGISLYTSPDGELQRRHLQEDVHVVIVAKSPRDLLEAMNTGVPSTVFVDGERVASIRIWLRHDFLTYIPLNILPCNQTTMNYR
jgi:hypothetical protein